MFISEKARENSEGGVIYIGDRFAGKTHLAMELANPHNQFVKVISPQYESLKSFLYDEKLGGTRPTNANKEVDIRKLNIQVRLPAGNKNLEIQWIDTPGEIWRKHWQKQEQNHYKWLHFLKTIRQSKAIILIVSPYRNIVKDEIDKREFITDKQWLNRFDRWLHFFQDECPNAKQLIICLNKADLFCDIEKEAKRLAYSPSGHSLDWYDRQTYIVKRYFKPIEKQIEQLNQRNYGLSINCFITSVYNRSLLELPWIYLGAYLKK
jgi:hypothetical protein